MVSAVTIVAVLALLLVSDRAYAQSNTHLFEAASILDARQLPALANGHLGYLPYTDTVHLTGLYSGAPNSTWRSRVPNYGRLQYEFCGPYTQGAEACRFTFDARRALFRTQSMHQANQFQVELLNYPHRVFDHTIVNHLTIRRTNPANTTDAFRVRLFASPGPNSDDFSIRQQVDAMWNATIPYTIYALALKSNSDIVVNALVERIPEMVTLPAGQAEITFTWVASVGIDDQSMLEHFDQATSLTGDALLARHVDEWQKFWSTGIEIEGNDELARLVYSSLYTVAASQLAPGRHGRSTRQGGVSPAGLGLTDYQGHTYWDTEIWLQPVALLLEQQWSADLLQHRIDRHSVTVANAKQNGFAGAQYPVQTSAMSVRLDDSEDEQLRHSKHHIGGDVAFAMRQYFAATFDDAWLRSGQRCNALLDIAKFWDSRLTYNSSTQLFDVHGITGPDATARNVSNNAYTNVLAANALFFGEFSSCLCETPVPSSHGTQHTWYSVARSIALGQSSAADGDYTLAEDGFRAGERQIGEADTVLISYPLHYPLNASTHLNNVAVAEAGLPLRQPSMTYAVHNIVRLGLGRVPTTTEFERTYGSYVRGPFYVWTADALNETALQPRVSAAAAFVQQLLNGYAGIRLHADRLEVALTALPPSVTRLTVSGFQYMKGTYAMEIGARSVRLRVLTADANTQIVIGGAVQANASECEFG